MKKRRRLTHMEKQAIKRAWNFKCAYCRDTVVGDACHIDHIVPVKHGGKCEIENLALSCIKCNHQKADARLPRMHEGLLLAAAARKAPKVRQGMKRTRVAKNKMLNAFLTSLADTIDGYGKEIDQVDIPVRLYSNQEEIKATISIPLKDVVYEEFIAEDEDNTRNTKMIVLERLIGVKERTKRSKLVKSICEENNLTTRSIQRYIKQLGEEGQANVNGGWVYPLQ
jgi:hypothetical protein